MRKISYEYLMQQVVCPVCGKKRIQGEMMVGTKKPICKHCWGKNKYYD